jgi:hypothetical protein
MTEYEDIGEKLKWNRDGANRRSDSTFAGSDINNSDIGNK